MGPENPTPALPPKGLARTTSGSRWGTCGAQACFQTLLPKKASALLGEMADPELGQRKDRALGSLLCQKVARDDGYRNPEASSEGVLCVAAGQLKP